jgi:predicted glycoside hydrolase/deacetylase ChbG (UPF0249 family)
MQNVRRLIVNADDFGQTAGINRGVLRGHDEGIVTSASLMVRWPAATDAARSARARPQLSVGLHIDLGEWRLIGSRWEEVYHVVTLTDRDAVEQEVAHQLHVFRILMGCEPTHLDSHQHVHQREPLRSVLEELADELAVPLRHFSPLVRYCGEFYGQDEQGHERAGVLSAENLLRIASTLRPGITELASHPAAVADLSTMYARERLIELEVLGDRRLRAALASRGIELCSFHDVPFHRRLAAAAGGMP